MDRKRGYKKTTVPKFEDVKLRIIAINAEILSLSIKDIMGMVGILFY